LRRAKDKNALSARIGRPHHREGRSRGRKGRATRRQPVPMTAEAAVQSLRSGGEVDFGAFIACADGLTISNEMADLFAPTQPIERKEFRLGKIVLSISKNRKPEIPMIPWSNILDARVEGDKFTLTYRGRASYWSLERVRHRDVLIEVIRLMTDGQAR
jgi:hypothetical protein